MSILRIATGALRALADAADRLDNGHDEHGPWCEFSKGWYPSHPGARIVPIRISEKVMGEMNSEKGWEFETRAVRLTYMDDGTASFIFEKAEEVDHLSNRIVQRMIGSALDLAESLDASNCDLSLEAIEALAEFKRAARQRLRAQT